MKKPLYNQNDRFWIKHYYNNVQLYYKTPLFIMFYEKNKFLSKLNKELINFFDPIIKFLSKFL